MKYKGSIDINSPKLKVVELFADAENLKEYQDGNQKRELVMGKWDRKVLFPRFTINMASEEWN